MTQITRPHIPSRLYRLTILLILISMACSLPGVAQPTPTTAPTSLPAASPTPEPLPLPPTLVETDPPLGAALPLSGPITFYFNQPMERASVEGALSGDPPISGAFTWLDDATVSFTPDTSFQPDTSLALNIASTAQSQGGMALLEPVSISFSTAGYLQVAQLLPVPGAAEIDPTSAIVATFNRAVVPLGAEMASQAAPFTLSPPAEGQGEWLNTGTYVFYPQPGLTGGITYTVNLDPALHSADGGPLLDVPVWSFATASPRLVSIQPEPGALDVDLDTAVRLAFNQPMNAASVEANFSMMDNYDHVITGQTAWNEDFTTFTYTPTVLLRRSMYYTTLLGSEAASLGGTPLDMEVLGFWWTAAPLQVINTTPAQNGQMKQYQGVMFYLSAPVPQEGLLEKITINPPVSDLRAYANEYDRSISVYGSFLPETEYAITLSADLLDRWGGALQQDYTLKFITAPLAPALTLPLYSEAYFLTPNSPGIQAQVTNLNSIPVSAGSVPLGDFIELLGSYGYNLRQDYQPANPSFWEYSLDKPANTTNPLDLGLNPYGTPAQPGLYFMRIGLGREIASSNPVLVAVSNYQLTFKLSPTEAFVWAVDLRSNQPVAGMPIVIYDPYGAALASGQTGADGVMRTPLTVANETVYGNFYAVMGQPGQENFGLAISNWSLEVNAWSFGITLDPEAPGLQAYLYTDRPIYRPGQTVYFRAVVRQAYNGRYTLPDLGEYPLTLYDNLGLVQESFNLTLNAFGTGQGEYLLPEDLQPGDYRLANDEHGASIYFQVAEYRKPEINLGLTFRQEQIRAGQSAVADLNARYFFDAPAGNLPVTWALYARPDYFTLPGGYQIGPYDARWLSGYLYGMGQPFGELITGGEAQTAPDGTLVLEMATETLDTLREYTLEVTIMDESGFPVSARASVWANPADHYIAVRPDAYAVQAGEEAGFDVFSAGWDGASSGARTLQAQFSSVTWTRQQDPSMPYARYVPEYTLVASTDFATGADGLARLAFTPQEPGTYMLEVTGDGARTQSLLWVGGPGSPVWPDLPNQRIELTPDRSSYQPGEVAQVFIPNPFSRASIALLTIERDTVLRYQVLSLEPGGTTYPIALSADDAPNVYVSVTILYSADGRSATWEQPDFRQGYVELVVEPVQQTLNVTVTSQPERSGPGETVTLSIRISDASGSPVQGEFSLAAVDLAVLALAEPNAPDIVSAFYGQQPLGVRTGFSLAADGQRAAEIAGGVGGGGGGEGIQPVVREDFPDTAFWNGQIITNPDGTATVTITLPDNLTTWQIDVRGVTQNTLVGQATIEIVTTKDLLIRPAAPRFLVVGDHLPLAAVVQNNTLSQVQATVSLQAAGFALDDPSLATQTVSVPAGGRTRVEWWGTAQDVDSADLLFAVQAGSLQDAVRLASGALPVLRYSAPQTFATAGYLDAEGQRLEIVSLPMSFDASSGALRLELAPSLAAAMMDALTALEHYPYECTEQTLSRFLPNLETYRTLQSFGIEAPDLQARLERTLDDGIETLLQRQNDDGGWAWWPGGESDTYITAYILFGLARAQQSSLSVPDETFQNAALYLSAWQMVDQSAEPWMLDRITLIHFALAQAGFGNPTEAGQLYGVRDQLSPWAQALLALTLEKLSPGSSQAQTLISDLQSTAERSATGVFWQTPRGDWRNMTTTISGSAMAIYALAQIEPASTLLPDAVRFLMAGRGADGAWASTYESAWAVLALTEYMKGTGELGGDFAFSATLNGVQIANGQASPGASPTPVRVETPLSSLYASSPNALAILRQAGSGMLYYSVALEVYRPVETLAPLERGLSISRSYLLDEPANQTDAALSAAQAGQSLTVRLTLIVPKDAYHLVVEDYIPAGAEILNTRLLTSQQGEIDPLVPLYDPRRPFESGWGWWLFQNPLVYDDHIAWAVEYLPAGTYTLTYTLVLTQPGQFHVLPARAFLFYFPEVQGSSAGLLFEIKARP